MQSERHADPIDAALEQTEAALEYTTQAAREKAQRLDTTNPSGICWNCHSEIGTERRWCDADCRDDWEIEQKQNQGRR